MATYKIKTNRYLRKYTAAEKLPVSSALVDAQRVVDELCNLPWAPVPATEAGVTSHDEGELDANVQNRDRFDAALFCAEHKNGEHRAYANAACYKVSFPAGTAGTRLTSLKVRVTSDAYNAYGARIALVTNSTGVIPTDCATCRGEGAGGVHADGVAPQTIETVGGKRYGYPTIADCVFLSEPAEGEVSLPSGGLVLGDFLYVFVLMENYNSVRGNWLEGSSCIRNLVEITTDAEISGWTDGGLVDLTVAATPREFAVARGGVFPSLPSDRTGVKTVCLLRNGDDLTALLSAEGISQDSPAFMNLSNVIAELDGPVTSVSVTPPLLAKMPLRYITGQSSSTVVDTMLAAQFAVVVGKFSRSSLAMMPGVLIYDMTENRLLEGIRCGNVNANVINAAVSGALVGGTIYAIRWEGETTGGTDINYLFQMLGLSLSLTTGYINAPAVIFGYDMLKRDVYSYVWSLNPFTFTPNVVARFVTCSAVATNYLSSATTPTCNLLFRVDNSKITCIDQSHGDISLQFPAAGVTYNGTITSIKAMSPTSAGRRIVVAGNLSSVGGIACRNCAIITFTSASATVSVPTFDSVVTPDTYEDFSVSPMVAAITGWERKTTSDGLPYYNNKYRPANDTFVVSGRFRSLSGERKHAKCVSVDMNGGRYVITAASTLPVVIDATATASDAVFYGRGTVDSSNPTVDASKIIASVTAEQSAIGLRTAYARLYRGNLYDVTKPMTSRPSAGFCVKDGTVSVTAVDSEGGSESVEVPVWKLSLASLVVPFSIPRDFTARRLSLSWPQLTATSHSLVNVWIKDDYVSEVPDVKSPAYFDGSAKTVDGWTLLGRIDVTSQTRTATFDLGALKGYVASLLFTAYVSLDDLNPSDTMTLPRGVGTIDVDPESGNVTDSDTGFRPDITLIG